MQTKLLILLSVLILTDIQAQSWCNAGARWYTSVYGPAFVGGQNAAVEYRYTGDTTILGKQCSVIKSKFSGKAWPLYGGRDTTINDYGTSYSYMHNDVLCVLRGSAFDTVVNFNATLGDRWLVREDCGVTRTYTVVSKGTVSYNGMILRSVTAARSFTFMNGANIDSTSAQKKFIETLGSGRWDGFFAAPCPLNPTLIYEGPALHLCGYRDDATPLQLSNASGCRDISGLGEQSSDFQTIRFFPNPGSGSFHMLLTEASEITVYNTLGALVFEKKLDDAGEYQIDLSEQSSGIYQLISKSKSGWGSAKLVKE